MAVEHLIVVGASSGGLEALVEIVSALPADLPAAVCVVVHVSPESPGTLPLMFNRAGTLPAQQVSEKQKLEHGRIYVALADHHLLIEPGVVRASRGPKENRFRPAVDPLFRSAAQVYGPRVIGVVLSGNLDDGTAGLWAIKQLGGVAVVQDPRDARFPSMPKNAVEHVDVDYCVPVAQIAPLLVRLTNTSVQDRAREMEDAMDVEVKIAAGANARVAGVESLGPPSPFACPDCHGVLLRLQEGKRWRFRCHTGHAYSLVSLLAAVNEAIDGAVWTAIRALDEGGRILRDLAQHHGVAEGNGLQMTQMMQGADAAFQDADTLRTVADRRGRRGHEGE